MSRLRTVAAAAVLFVIAAAPFTARAGQQAAGDPPAACTGKDLFDEARRNDPTAYRAILDRTSRIPNADGLLWEIEKAGAAPSYLFGTMHVTDAGSVALARSMAEYVKQTRTVATELGAAIGPGMKIAVGIKLGLRALAGKIDSASLIDPADRVLVAKMLARLHLDPTVVLRMPPWFVASLLALPPCEVERQQRDLPVVDHVIEDIGESFGAKLVGLETIDEQIDALASLEPKYAVRMIVSTARKDSFADDAFATMMALYKEQRIGAMTPTLEIAADLSPEDVEADGAFLTRIVESRNLVMRRRAEPLIDAGPTFIAVGAMHLVGAQGLVELLRRDGYSVTRVP